jgi:hypothetical protein
MIGWGARLVLSTWPQLVIATKEGSPILPQLSAKVKMLSVGDFFYGYCRLWPASFLKQKNKSKLI